MGRHTQQSLLYKLQLSISLELMTICISFLDWWWVKPLFCTGHNKKEERSIKREKPKGVGRTMTSLGSACSHVLGKWKKAKVAQSCSTLWDPMDYTVQGILQARILEWVAFPSPGNLHNPGIKPRSPTLQADSLPAELQGMPKNTRVGSLSLL